jgi:hypothetical protein
MSYAFVSAVVGTQSVLQSKCLAELLKVSISGDNQFDTWFLYVDLLAFLAGLSFWLYRMNMALKMFDGLIIIPLLQVFWTTSAILQGGMYFQEFDGMGPMKTLGFGFGVLTVFIGVYFLAPVDDLDAEVVVEELLAEPGLSDHVRLLEAHRAMSSSGNGASVDRVRDQKYDLLLQAESR